ncbi:hypothetical protein ACFYL6_06550 [Micromonospora sp. NPDC007208]|uniref:hypothetical protein n=1 Tax=Micromonospora sp. NPDC007208 TaxID=3364236 RepID=UPI0036A1FEE3
MLVTVSWLGLYHYLARHHDLLDQAVPSRFFPAERARAAIGLGGYALAILVGFLASPLFALVILLLLPPFYSLTSSGVRATTPAAPARIGRGRGRYPLPGGG